MTRETKIGLLVGLAFIIVIGILLSDHMTSTTQPPTAALADVAPNVRESVTSPAPTNPGPAPVVNVPPITPANPVLTQSELHRPVAPPPTPANVAPPVSQVVIGGPAGQQPGGAPIAIRQSGSPLLPQLPVQQLQQPGQVVIGGAPAQPEDTTSALEQWTQTQGGPGTATITTPPAQPTPMPAASGPKREYVAVAGDSLSRIAAKTLGSDNKANREAIVKANPTLQKNPNLVVEGRKYMIPATATAPAAAAGTPTAPAVIAKAVPAAAQIPDTVPVAPRTPAKVIPVTELVDVLPASSPAAGGGYWYVVKENDNLWKIASEQLGSGNAWLQLKELNKDVLKGGETVQPNMRLRLPAKPLASAAG